MKEKILILNIMKYEKEGALKSRVAFILADEKNIANREKFKGYSDLAFYYDGVIPFDVLPLDIIGQVVDGVFLEKSHASNPFKKSTILSEVEFKGKTYKLC